jgi:hypothetical protein
VTMKPDRSRSPNETRKQVERAIRRLERSHGAGARDDVSTEPIMALTPFSRYHYPDREPGDVLSSDTLDALDRACGFDPGDRDHDRDDRDGADGVAASLSWL